MGLLATVLFLPRLIFWLMLVLFIMWFVKRWNRDKPAPPYVGIPEINRFFADTRKIFEETQAAPEMKIDKQSNGERHCREVLADYYGRSFPKDSAFARNPVTNRFLELDGVNYPLRLAFEYQGKHHYHDLRQAQRDVIKRRLCDERNIYLIPIPYKIPLAKIRHYIASLLPTTLDHLLVDDDVRDFVREVRRNTIK